MDFFHFFQRTELDLKNKNIKKIFRTLQKQTKENISIISQKWFMESQLQLPSFGDKERETFYARVKTWIDLL